MIDKFKIDVKIIDRIKAKLYFKSLYYNLPRYISLLKECALAFKNNIISEYNKEDTQND